MHDHTSRRSIIVTLHARAATERNRACDCAGTCDDDAGSCDVHTG
jgi:hypothetical protein